MFFSGISTFYSILLQFLEIPRKFFFSFSSENFHQNPVEKRRNSVEKQQNLQNFRENCTKNLAKFCKISEFGAVRRNADLVELEKC